MNSAESTTDACCSRQTLNRLRDMLGAETLAGLISMYMDESEQMLADIAIAIDADDLEVLERSVHLLKGASSNFGLDRLVANANAAMKACREGRRDEAQSIAHTLPPLTHEAVAALRAFSAGLA